MKKPKIIICENMLTNIYLLKLNDRIICSSDSKVVLNKLIKKLKKDLSDIEDEFENGKELLINSGKYPINDPEVDAPVYSKALTEQFKLLNNKIWTNTLNTYICHKNATWCEFKIEKVLMIKAKD